MAADVIRTLLVSNEDTGGQQSGQYRPHGNGRNRPLADSNPATDLGDRQTLR